MVQASVRIRAIVVYARAPVRPDVQPGDGGVSNEREQEGHPMTTREFCRRVRLDLPTVWAAWLDAARNDKLLTAQGPEDDEFGRQ